MNRPLTLNERRDAAGIVPARASGNHLVAQNDESEPVVTTEWKLPAPRASWPFISTQFDKKDGAQ